MVSSQAPACVERANDARSELSTLILKGVLDCKPYADLDAEAKGLVTEKALLFDGFRETILEAADGAASQIALRSPVPEAELSRLVDILQGFGVQSYATEFAQRRWYAMAYVGMSHILWQALHDVTPYYDASGRMQFNLHSGELPIVASGKVAFAEERSVSTHERTYGGLSVPVGGGCCYHIGVRRKAKPNELQACNQSIWVKC